MDLPGLDDQRNVYKERERETNSKSEQQLLHLLATPYHQFNQNFYKTTMANLPRPFLIELDGQIVANPRMSGEMDEYAKFPASIGDRANAAVFELRDGYLGRLGGPQPLHFGRFFVEPPLFGPLPLYWIANRDQVRPCQYIGEEDSPQTFEMAGTSSSCNRELQEHK